MQVEIFVLDGGHWEGQYAFQDWGRDDQHKVVVTVPDGSELAVHGRKTVLRMTNGRDLSAAQVLDYCRMGVAGYTSEEGTTLRHFEHGKTTNPLPSHATTRKRGQLSE